MKSEYDIETEVRATITSKYPCRWAIKKTMPGSKLLAIHCNLDDMEVKAQDLLDDLEAEWTTKAGDDSVLVLLHDFSVERISHGSARNPDFYLGMVIKIMPKDAWLVNARRST